MAMACVKFKDFSRTSKRLSYCFQGLKTYENTDLHIKILLQKCWTALLKILVLENLYKISVKLWCLYLVQHMLHQIKAPQFYTDLDLKNSVVSSCKW